METFSTLVGRLLHRKAAAELDEQPVERRSQSRCGAAGEVLLHWRTDHGKYVAEPVRTSNSSPDGIGVHLTRPLPVGLPVWIEDDEVLLKAVIRHCEEDQEGYYAGLLKIHVERRRLERDPTHETGTLYWNDAAGGGQSSPVILRNVSEQGFQLETLREIPAESMVRLSFGAWECSGSTRYCRSAAQKYLVGMQLTCEPYPRSHSA